MDTAAPPANLIRIADIQTLMLNRAFFFSVLPRDARTMIEAYLLRITPHVHDPARLQEAEAIPLNPSPGIVEYMCVAPDGCIVMCTLRRVYVFNQQGRCTWTANCGASFAACAVATDWTIYLSVSEKDSVYAVKPSLGRTRIFSSGVLLRPGAIALNRDESKIYVVSKALHCVSVIDTVTAEALTTIHVEDPCGVAILSSDYVAISSFYGKLKHIGSSTFYGQPEVIAPPTINVFDAIGQHLKLIQLWRHVPSIGIGLAADRTGNLYIEQGHNKGVVIVSAITSDLIGYFGDGLRGIALCPDGAVARWDSRKMHLFRSPATAAAVTKTDD